MIFLVLVMTGRELAYGRGLDGSSYPSIFSDHKAHEIGNVVTVLIIEEASASNQASTQSSKENKLSASSPGGTGGLDFMAMYGLSAGTKNEFTGDGATSRQGVLKAKLTARVVAIEDGGHLLIEGSREIGINDEKEIITLSGTVRSEDITRDNTVYSYQIANAQIVYKGKGNVNTGQRPGIIARFFNWLF